MLNLIKQSGDPLYAKDINDIVNEINTKPDAFELPDFKTINGQTIVGTGNITIEGGSGEVDLSDYLKSVDAVSTYQPKGNYLTSVAYADITGKPLLFSGSYADLTNKPVIPSLAGYLTTEAATNSYQPKGNYLTSVSWNDVSNKPALFSGAYADLSGKPTIPSLSGYATEDFVTSRGYLTSVSWSAVTNKPTLFSGAYNDLTGKPTLFSGSYADLTNRPTIPSIAGLATETYVNAQGFLKSVSWAAVTGKPTLFDGNYNSLTNRPTIPSITGLATETYVTSRGYITASAITNKADLVAGKVPNEQLSALAFNSNQFELSTVSGTTQISLKQSFIDSLGGGTVTPTPALNASTVTFGTSTATSNIVNWSTVTNATSYVVRRADNSAMTGSTTIYTGSLLTFTDNGLTASTTYYYNVTASATGYTSSTSATAIKATSSAGGGFTVNRRLRANLTSEYGSNVPASSVTWNNLKPVSLTADQSYLSPNLVTETNVATTIKITNIGAWDGAQNSIFDTYGVPANAVYPYEVVGSCWKFQRDASNKIRITGLDDAKYYHFYVGSCDKFDNRTNTIKIGNESKTKSTFNNYGVAGENEFASAFNQEFKNKQSTGGILEIELNTVGFYIGFVASIIIEESNTTKP